MSLLENSLCSAPYRLQDDRVASDAHDHANSETTSISSSLYAGYIKNGNRYQTTLEGEYWGPSDEKQFESMNKAYLAYLIVDSASANPLFRSPISEAENVLEIGIGIGAWAREVADKFLSTTVTAIDLLITT